MFVCVFVCMRTTAFCIYTELSEDRNRKKASFKWWEKWIFGRNHHHLFYVIVEHGTDQHTSAAKRSRKKKNRSEKSWWRVKSSSTDFRGQMIKIIINNKTIISEQQCRVMKVFAQSFISSLFLRSCWDNKKKVKLKRNKKKMSSIDEKNTQWMYFRFGKKKQALLFFTKISSKMA